MTLRFDLDEGQLSSRTDVLAVDGVFGVGPNLSHWPGHRTPAKYRHDLSTGSALLFAADPDRDALLRDVTTVANNHYDTDGVLSVFAVLHPKRALPLAGPMLDAATAGDFMVVRSEAALRFDAIVMEIGAHPASPLADDVRGLRSFERWRRSTRWLIERIPELLRDQGPLEPLWIDAVRAFDTTTASFASGRSRMEKRPGSLAVVDTDHELDTAAVVTLAQPCCRILTRTHGPDGVRIRFVHTTHSWFDRVTPTPRRFDLLAVAEFLNEGRPPQGPRWIASEIAAPIAELAFGLPVKPAHFTDSKVGLSPVDDGDACLKMIEAASA